MRVLAIEGGGTRSTAGLYDDAGALVAEGEGGPCNPVSGGLDAALAEIRALAARVTAGRGAAPDLVAVALAGLFSEEWRQKVAGGVCRVLHVSKALASDDFNPLLHANARAAGGVLAIAGTGSKVAGLSTTGETAQAGGRGMPFGEDGSAYRIANDALRAVAAAIDGVGPDTSLVSGLPRAVGAVDFAAFIDWANHATKRQLADLARAIASAAEAGDAVAGSLIEAQARRMSEMALAVAKRLLLAKGAPVFMNGGLFDFCTGYRTVFEDGIRSAGYVPSVPRLRGHRAVFEMTRLEPKPEWLALASAQPKETLSLPPTELRSRGTKTLDRMSAIEIVRHMNEEDANVIAAVAHQAACIARVVEQAADAIRSGGRIIYVGAGTSGRLGVLDASECPPTFGVAPDRVVALMAGGDRALRQGVEGAEDDRDQGAADVLALEPTARDVVVGIAASGTTPYVRAALEAAGKAGARTALLCCNPQIGDGADHVIALDTGPEVLAGSTRLKAGTATKLVLNIVSTGAMALAGYVYDGQMVGMQPVNEKLWKRAIRIVTEIGGIDETRAETLLRETSGHIATAILMARRGVSLEEARRLIAETGVRGIATLG